MVKLAYEVSFLCPSTSGYNTVIIKVEEENKNNRAYIKLKIQEILSKRYGYSKEQIEITNKRKIKLSTIKLSDITIEDFALLFDLGGHLRQCKH